MSAPPKNIRNAPLKNKMKKTNWDGLDTCNGGLYVHSQ